MRAGGRLAAAIDVLDDILVRHRTAPYALAEWAKAHRFAGSGDRSAIGTLVYDALRRRRSIASRMGEETGRALALGAAADAFTVTPEEVIGYCTGEVHAPAVLSDRETHGVRATAADLPKDADGAAADVPAWLWPSFIATFGDAALSEGQALAMRAPVDLRANTLKAPRDRAAAGLADIGAVPTAISPVGLRIQHPKGLGRIPHIEADPLFVKGYIEIQDEGSQIAALIAAAAMEKPGQVLDLCAGGGGKTLAIAATMQNRGQIFAYDTDRLRLAPIHGRLKRAGVRNVQVMAAKPEALAELNSKMDLVIVDAPCSGSGTWRRRPDAKWRLTQEQVEKRQEEQASVLTDAVVALKPGGRLVYITCSFIAAENEGAIDKCLSAHPEMSAVPAGPLWLTAFGDVPFPQHAKPASLLLTPATTHTDGFFIAVLEKRKLG